MTATGLGYPAVRPALGRLAHIRAVLAARLWMAASPAWAGGQAWWHSERRLRADSPAVRRGGHVADAEIHWPSIEASPSPAATSRPRPASEITAPPDRQRKSADV